MLSKKNQLEANKLQKRLRRQVGQAIADFNMIEAGRESESRRRAHFTPLLLHIGHAAGVETAWRR